MSSWFVCWNLMFQDGDEAGWEMDEGESLYELQGLTYPRLSPA